jgi:uncharacterized protein YjbI with pentapeptide repeats
MNQEEFDNKFAQGQRAFSNQDLRHLDLTKKNLSGCYFEYANLQGADFTGQDLRKTSLKGAILRAATMHRTKLTPKQLKRLSIVPEGDLIVYKKVLSLSSRYSRRQVIKLKIPAGVPRVGGLIGRKCRAERAVVLEGAGISRHDGITKYKPRKTVVAPNWDPDPRVECSGGIHFFLTKEEALDY